MLLAVLPVIVWPLLPWPRPRWVDFLPGAGLLLMLASLLLEGYRWQMLPAYGLVLILFLVTLPRLRGSAQQEGRRSRWAIAASVAGLLVWLFALALPTLLPVPRLPEMSGPYAVGTQTVHLVDESRAEIYTEDASDKREIMMQVWYPAQEDGAGETAVYLPDLDVMAPVLAERLGLPSFLLDHVNLTALDVRQDAPLLTADAPYPLLLFSHGLSGIRAQNTAMVRELASQGFVVATIDHTYGNVLTIFPDGRTAFFSPDLFSGEGDPPHTGNTLVGVWAADIGQVLDELAAWNETPDNEFSGNLDLARVGVFGHSTGGGAAVAFCGKDERCRAGVGLDAWLVPVADEIIAQGAAQPFLFLRADAWEFDDAAQNDARAEQLLAESETAVFLATIAGAAHYDFSDLPLFSPLTAQLGLSSAMDSRYVVEMMTSMTAAFFRQELLDDGENLLFGAMAYPEMSLLGNGK